MGMSGYLDSMSSNTRPSFTRLRELKSAEEELDRLRHDAPSYIIPADMLKMLRDVGPQLPDLWNAKLLSDAQKKALLRSLIDKVVIHRLAPG